MSRHFLAASVFLFTLAFVLLLITFGNHPATLQSSVSARSMQPPAQFPVADAGSRATTVEGQTALRAKVAEIYGKIPLSFEANRGQTDRRVKFVSRNATYTGPNETKQTGQCSGL